MVRSSFLTSLAVFSALVAGCGSLADDVDKHEPLAVLQGELTNPNAVATSSTVRVAVIWNCGDLDGQMYRVSQEVEVQPVFPSRFRLELTQPPPAGCMIDPFAESENDDPPGVPPDGPDPVYDAPGDTDVPSTPPSAPQDTAAPSSFRMALGTIAAYDDLNGNGKLDLASPGDPDFVDRVLGANESLMLVYLEGTVPSWDELRDADGNLPSRGYNLLDFNEPISAGVESGDVLVMCVHPDAGGEPIGGSEEPVPMPEMAEDSYEGPSLRWLDASTFFVLTMTADPTFASMMCKDGGFGDEMSSGAAPAPGQPIEVPPEYPLPGDPGLTCSSDGLSYFYETCEDQGVCRGKICYGGCWYVPDVTNPPAAWPCPIP